MQHWIWSEFECLKLLCGGSYMHIHISARYLHIICAVHTQALLVASGTGSS